MILHLLSYVAMLLGGAMAIMSIACALYYLAELVEEYTRVAKKIIKWTIYITILLHPFLWLVDGLPFARVAFGLFCHLWYSSLLPEFPVIELTSISFLGSCVLAIIDHFTWFYYFSDHYHPFYKVVTLFTLCVWLVPFQLFISLTANDYTLPNYDPNSPTAVKPPKPGQNLIKKLIGLVVKREEALPTETRKQF